MSEFVYIVWLQYPGTQHKRLSAVFASKAEADKYAHQPESTFCAVTVTREEVFSTADDV